MHQTWCCRCKRHPEARAAWEHLINKQKLQPMGFCTTVHERCLHAGHIDKQHALLCLQVEDCGVSALTAATPDKVVDDLPTAPDPLPTENHGLMTPPFLLRLSSSLSLPPVSLRVSLWRPSMPPKTASAFVTSSTDLTSQRKDLHPHSLKMRQPSSLPTTLDL